MTSSEQTTALTAALRSPDLGAQSRGLVQVEEEQITSAYPDVLALCTSPDELVRAGAACALGVIGGVDRARTSTALRRLLKDGDDLVRVDAAEAVTRLGLQETAATLLTVLPDETDATVRASIVEALGAIRERGAGPVLLLLARRDPDEAVRGYAANALGDLADPSVTPTLVAALPAQSPRVRVEYLLALARLGWPDALPHLVQLLPGLRGEPLEVLVNALLGFEGRFPAVLRAPELQRGVLSHPAIRAGERTALARLFSTEP